MERSIFLQYSPLDPTAEYSRGIIGYRDQLSSIYVNAGFMPQFQKRTYQEETEMKNRKSLRGLLIILGAILLFSNNGACLTVTSDSFKYNANIPLVQGCTYFSGGNISPQLSLSVFPPSTMAFALIMDDPDAPGGTYLHWLMYWNSPGITTMNEGNVPAGAVLGINDNSTISYFGPCPPSNHRYYFRVYALDTTLSLSAGFTRNQLESAMVGHILESNFLMGWFPSGGVSCTYTLSPQFCGYSNSATSGKIAVTCSSINCTWTAVSNSSWLTITSGSSGAGSGTVAYTVAANSSTARTGSISIAGQTVTVTQNSSAVTNSVGPRNTIKVTDMSGSLAASGAAINIRAWDVNGTAISESASAPPLKLFNFGTTMIPGTTLAARFPTGTPVSYEFTVDSSKVIITNVKASADGSINIPSGYTSGTSNFVANSIGPRNTVKVTDMSGTLIAAGVAITVRAWDVNGNEISESGSASPLKLFSHETTTISGNDLAARFPAGSPISYEFAVASSKVVITNVKSNINGNINIPYVYTRGTNNFVSNSIGPQNTVKVTDMSGSLDAGGSLIIVSAWDVVGNAIPESSNAVPLRLYSHGTTTISGNDLAARFPTRTAISYNFDIGSSKVLVTNIKSNTDNTINIPSGYTSGISNFVSNTIGPLNVIKVTDMSGYLVAGGAAITVSAWGVTGNSIQESGSAAPLRLNNYGTTTITGTDLAARFPTGTPASYEFSIGSTKVIVTNITGSTDGSINIPFVYTSGLGGGI